MLEPEFYKPLPKNPNLLVRKREYELIGGKSSQEIEQDETSLKERQTKFQQLKKSREALKESKDKLRRNLFGGKFTNEESLTEDQKDELKKNKDNLDLETKLNENKQEIKTLKDENNNQLQSLSDVITNNSDDQKKLEKIKEQLKKEIDAIEKELQETPGTAPSSPRIEPKKLRLINDEQSIIKELEEFFEPIFQQAVEPFWQVIYMIEQDSGKCIYARYVKDLSMEKRKIPINYGCKTWEEFKTKNHHLGFVILEVMHKKYLELKKGIGDTVEALINYAFSGLPDHLRPPWIAQFINDPVFHFLLQNASFGALQMAANELKFPLHDLIYSPHVNFMFAQFVSVKFVKPKSNAYPAGIQGQDMQFRISSGVYTGQQQSKWLMGCKLWFQDVYYKSDKELRITEIDKEIDFLSARQRDLRNENIKLTTELKDLFQYYNYPIFPYWDNVTDQRTLVELQTMLRRDEYNKASVRELFRDLLIPNGNKLAQTTNDITKKENEKREIQNQFEGRVLFKK